jgi:hypothetical protein
MAVTKNLGMLLLAIFLIAYGVVGLGVTFPHVITILAILAIAAGVCILIGR